MNSGAHLTRTIHKLVSKPGLRGKLDAKCCECIYDPCQEGAWRQQVSNCTSTTCPLFSVRTKSKNSKEANNE